LNDKAPVDELSASGPEAEAKNPLLIAFGERLRTLRARRGLTRKEFARAADVSERYLANLELGTGNASFLILLQLAKALQCSPAEVIGDMTTASPEWLMIREMLQGKGESDLAKARIAIGQLLGTEGDQQEKRHRVALIGLRGAGKSTLGKMLAEDLGLPFIELSRIIEDVAGYSVREIQDLYGVNAYRRYERRALEETLQIYPDLVLATPGGLVSDPTTFNVLLSHCTTVWLQASPEDHLNRVALQGDMRPMAASVEAMDDLRQILAGRSAFYSKARLTVDTSRQPLAETFRILRDKVREAVGAQV
jgi:XRE family transcriptional regulator, aerobic/anaerobic benzoate catabolism transcriptional regulator